MVLRNALNIWWKLPVMQYLQHPLYITDDLVWSPRTEEVLCRHERRCGLCITSNTLQIYKLSRQKIYTQGRETIPLYTLCSHFFSLTPHLLQQDKDLQWRWELWPNEKIQEWAGKKGIKQLQRRWRTWKHNNQTSLITFNCTFESSLRLKQNILL